MTVPLTPPEDPSRGVRSDGYYRFFPGDYARDTGDLSLLEHGAYRILLDHYYSEAQLPSDITRLYRICRAFTSEEQAAVSFVIARFFGVKGDHLINARAERELAARREFVVAQSRKGRLSAAARRKRKTALEEEVDDRGCNRGSAGVEPGHEPEGEPNGNQASASALAPAPQSQSEDEGQKTKAPPRSKNPPAAFVLPDHVRPEVWTAFAELRKAMRKPLTDYAAVLTIRKLDKIKAQTGDDPNEVLEQSIERGWLGVFPIGRDSARAESKLEPKGFAAIRELRIAEGRDPETGELLPKEVQRT